METKNGFTLLTVSEFETWIKEQNVARTILYIQQHHTYIPNYGHFSGSNHFITQQGMRNTHVSLGWVEIAQHFSIFPDGKICTGRSLEWNPAGIYGFNNYSICIENIGYFDKGKDEMTQAQADAIIAVTAALCKRFAIPVTTDRIVYHHWFDLNTGARTNGAGVTKTCPGTNFFGGNKVENCKKNFLPLVIKRLGKQSNAVPAILKYGCVTVNELNIRSKASTSGKKIGTATLGSVLRIHAEKGGWYKISSTKEEWVFGNYVREVSRATVNADVLNVRSGPGTNFNKLSTVTKGEEVFIYKKQDGWCKIGIEERWVKEEFLN